MRFFIFHVWFQGSWCSHSGTVMGNHFVHSMANGWNAWNGSWKTFDRYHELGQQAFGEKLRLWIVVPQQFICEVGVDIVYMVTGGKSLQKVYKILCKKDCKSIKTTYFIIIFASVHFVLSHLPNFNSISGVSLAAAVMSLRYPSALGVKWS
jgi:hypothetical protein